MRESIKHSHQRATRQRNTEQVVEDEVGDQGEDRGDERIAVEVAAAEG
ncbi:hypothetical protein HRW19_26755 [Streptomyces lunaelactis]|nr:hypothetical protein [Streptomyces lunaelactis]